MPQETHPPPQTAEKNTARTGTVSTSVASFVVSWAVSPSILGKYCCPYYRCILSIFAMPFLQQRKFFASECGKCKRFCHIACCMQSGFVLVYYWKVGVKFRGFYAIFTMTAPLGFRPFATFLMGSQINCIHIAIRKEPPERMCFRFCPKIHILRSFLLAFFRFRA